MNRYNVYSEPIDLTDYIKTSSDLYRAKGWKGGIVFFCNICHSAFMEERNMQYHMKVHHTIEEKIEWSALIFNPTRRDSGVYG